MKNPNLGGKRPGSGRKKGSPNKVTIQLKQMASKYTAEAVKTLVDVMRDPEVPAAVRVVAADKLLDRSHGRPLQGIEIPSNKVDKELIDMIEGKILADLEEAMSRQERVLIERGILIKAACN